MPTLDKARAPPNCCFQFVVGIIRKSACCLLCRARHKRHTFGSLLIQAGAPLPYVRDQMGHSSIQITADKYVHLISGRNVGFVDQLDTPATRQQSATHAQLEADSGERSEKENQLQVVEGEAWCERGESNPHGFPRQILSLVRLPIPPLSH